MTTKAMKAQKGRTLKNLSAEALEAVKQFKGFKAPGRPRKLQGKHAAAIRKAVRGYYIG